MRIEVGLRSVYGRLIGPGVVFFGPLTTSRIISVKLCATILVTICDSSSSVVVSAGRRAVVAAGIISLVRLVVAEGVVDELVDEGDVEVEVEVGVDSVEVDENSVAKVDEPLTEVVSIDLILVVIGKVVSATVDKLAVLIVIGIEAVTLLLVEIEASPPQAGTRSRMLHKLPRIS